MLFLSLRNFLLFTLYFLGDNRNSHQASNKQKYQGVNIVRMKHLAAEKLRKMLINAFVSSFVVFFLVLVRLE